MVKEWCKHPSSAENRYGHISHWNVSNITSMSSLFGMTFEEGRRNDHWNKDFNEDLSKWDLSNVQDTQEMIKRARSFEGKNIGCWNVEKVRNMEGMFKGAVSFNCDLSDWKIEKVTNMKEIFWVTSSFSYKEKLKIKSSWKLL